jgi:hypothetical protein
LPKRTLFIFGAGCSANYKDATHGIDNIYPPTNDIFFRTLRQLLKKTKTNSKKEIKQLFIYLCGSRGIDYDSDMRFLDNDLNDMEEVITDLSIKTNLFESSYGSFQSDLLEILKELISYTFGRTLYGPVSKNFKQLVKLITPNDVVIIFNYDLLIENALKIINKFNVNGYQIEYYKYKNGDVWQKEKKESKIKIYKLHGSINWIKCNECGSIYILNNNEYDKNIFEYKKIKKEVCLKCKEKNTLNRLIVPPILHKNYNEQPFRFLWRNAEKEIINIERIASLGYSLPPTDYTTRSLLRSILKEEPKKEIGLLTMNRSPESDTNYRKLFPNIRKPLRSINIEDFISMYKKWK